MQIYNYDRETGVYTGEGSADADPMRPGHFLLPACSTSTKPPTGAALPAGHVAVFNRSKDKWGTAPAVQNAHASPSAQSAPTVGQQVFALRTLVVDHANATARGAGFDSMDEAVTYAEEPAVPAFQRMGRALRAWRSLLWAAFEDMERSMVAGDQSLPTSRAAFMAQLPKFTLPQDEQASTGKA